MADEILRNGNDEEQPTALDAYNNVDAGNVSTSTNRTYGFGDFYRIYGEDTNGYYNIEPPFAIHIPIDATGQTHGEGMITLQNGVEYGIDQYNTSTYEMWIYDGQNELGQTINGHPFTGRWFGGFLNTWTETFEDPLDPQVTYTVHMTATELTLSNDVVWADSNPKVWLDENHPAMQVVSVTRAISDFHYQGQTLVYNYPYNGTDIAWATWGYFFDSVPTYIENMATTHNTPIIYPGEGQGSFGGGGNGTYTDVDEDSPEEHAPTVNPLAIGFVKVYNPSEMELRAISQWLWSDEFEANIKKNFASPFENIISLGYAPLEGKLGTPQLEDMVVGNCVANGQDGMPQITLKKVTNPFVKIECGSLTTNKLPKYWDGFLDHNSNFTLWLPYIGFRSIRGDDIWETEANYASISLDYFISVLTGEVVAIIKSLQNGHRKTIATFSGNCLAQTPVSGSNFTSMYNQLLAASVAGNMNKADKIGNLANTAASIASSAMSGDVTGIITSFVNGGVQDYKLGQQKRLIDRQKETAAPEYGRCGNMSGNIGGYCARKPYIIKSRPICVIPPEHTHYNGIPAFRYSRIGDLEGYTEMQAVELMISGATQKELQAIEGALTSGTYL